MEGTQYHPHLLNRQFIVEKLVTIFYSEICSGFYGKGETHNFWELVYVDRGEILVQTHNQQFTMKRGQICFHPPMEFHRIITTEREDASICIISFLCSTFASLPDHSCCFYLAAKEKDLLSQVMDYSGRVFDSIEASQPYIQMSKRQDSKPSCEQVLLNYLEIFLLQSLLDHHSAAESSAGYHLSPNLSAMEAKEDLVEKAKQYMIAQLTQSIRLMEVCHAVGCSKSTLSLAFKNSTGYTPMTYFNMLKIEKAKEIIKTEKWTMAQISYHLNFCNVHFFSANFKKFTGVSPSEYANSIKSRNCVFLLKNTVS